jgi:TetR/AcrR family transcriptional repressor of lmrAB and yxaGH operons
MSSPSTRDKILRSAQTLLAQSGLSGAGLNQLIAASGAPRGSLYHYFPEGKEQWVGEALRVYGDYFLKSCDQLLAQAPTLGAGIAAILGQLAVQLEKTGFSGGCPVGAVILDLDANSPALRQTCQQVMQSWQAELVKRFDQVPAARQAELAQFVLLTLEGALMLARLQRNASPLHTAAKMLRQCIDLQLSQPQG